MTTALYSLSISARATLDMHSLNNEGGEGNQIQTRMVNIVGADGRLHNVNAISGDMFKHIQAEHLFRRATDGAGLPLCAACREFNANRISADPEFAKAIEGLSDAEAIDLLLATCALDDMAGNLITAGNRSIPRKSVAEFGWVVGLPELTTTDSYFHVKYASERSADRRAADSAETARGANLGQAIFHRPASSGVYAIVANFELARIGFNDITQTYPISNDERRARHAALLESVLYTFLEPNGAMRGTQNPHIVSFDGVVAVSKQVVPAPAISPLGGDFVAEVERVRAALDTLRPGALELYPFASLGEFTEVMTRLIQSTEPFTLAYAG
ncbi:MAG: DevR family CRISPR-associated autoregulator [Thermoplasmata archaeon]|nr:MAG: DevR family CRISPR-associated autoregulator [Thermoplasmata archaeon]RLF50850.1 MAG: DevR family CRISPR-associated autoregulator [Thermoplasmata archaeon]